jgi:GNAT superfamily N-acetyltransferase
MKPSVMYNMVRSRQLEGTYNDDIKIGVWVVSSLRIMRGLGCPLEEQWPFDGDPKRWPPKEPENIDAYAKENRIFAYQRVKSLEQCKYSLASDVPLLYATKVYKSWHNAPHGVIPMPKDNDVSIGSHCVCIVGYNDNTKLLTFANSWGTAWGDSGYGYLPYDYFQSNILESWLIIHHNGLSKKEHKNDTLIYEWGIPAVLNGFLHGIEIRDESHDDRKGWAFAIINGEYLDVEELFVMPKYRRHGDGSKMLDCFVKLSHFLSKRFRMWVPFADICPDNVEILRHMMGKRGLVIQPSETNWACYQIVNDV